MANILLINFLLIGKYKKLIKCFLYCNLHCEIATTYIRKAVSGQNVLAQSQQWKQQ